MYVCTQLHNGIQVCAPVKVDIFNAFVTTVIRLRSDCRSTALRLSSTVLRPFHATTTCCSQWLKWGVQFSLFCTPHIKIRVAARRPWTCPDLRGCVRNTGAVHPFCIGLYIHTYIKTLLKWWQTAPQLHNTIHVKILRYTAEKDKMTTMM